MSCSNYNISQEPSLSGGGGGGGEVLWGALTGTLSNQTDLVNELNDKADVSHTHSTSDVTGLDATLANKLEETDLKTINGNSIVGTGDLVITGSGSPSWGDIIGTLTLQTDLNTALLNKADVIHNHNDIYFTETEITTLLAGKSDVAHNHDTRYYTETEIDTFLSGKANTSHSHSTSDVTGLDTALLGKSDVSHNHDTRYYTETEIDTFLAGKANTTHSHSTSDITGLDAALLDKSDVGHTHDDRYYTETEIDTALSGKANTSHNHDDRYYTETEIDTQMSGKQPTLVSGTNIKTINGVSLLAAGDIVISGGGSSTWGSITGTIASQTDLINLVATKADVVHNHDDRYYTETEIDTALSGKQATITAGSLGIDKLDIDGGTDIGEALADADLLIVDNGATGTNVKSALSRFWTYISSKLTGAISTVIDTNLTASKALISNASGKIEASTVTSTELGLLSGMTGLQAPLGYTAENVANKENTALDTSTIKYPTNRLVKEVTDAKQPTITAGSLGIDKLDIDGATDIGEALADADLLIVDNGATGTNRKSALSRVWTYISSKITGAISGLLTTNLTASRALASDASGKITATSVTSTELGLLSGKTSIGTVTSVGLSSTDLSVSGSPVTSSGNITANINNDAVTFAKMQNIDTAKLLGRGTAGTGDIEQITIGSGLTLSGTTLSASGGGGLTNWTESTNTYSSRVGVRFAPNNAATNVDAVISPKGTGAFYLGAYADGTSTGGNNRGENAIEMTLVRNDASQVASGSHSVQFGNYAKSISNNTIAIGTYSFANSTNGISIGYNSSSTAFAAISIGRASTASYEAIAIGSSAVANTTNSIAIGAGTTSNATATTALGYYANAARYGQLAYATGSDAKQFGLYLLNIATTDATPAELYLDGSSARLTIRNDALYYCEIMIIGKTSGAVTGYKYERRVVIAKGASAATTAILGSIDVIGTDYEDNASADISITANTTNGSLKIEVTGIAATSISWFAIVKTTELVYA